MTTQGRIRVLAVMLAALVGCTTSSGEVGAGAHFVVTFDFDHIPGSGSSGSGCPSGFPTVAVIVQPVDDHSNASGVGIIDLFDCTASVATTDGMPPGTYAVSVESTDDNGLTIYAKSIPQIFTIPDNNDADIAVAAQIFVDGGYFEMQWTFDGGTASCADVPGLAAVEVIATAATGANAAYPHVFTCEAGLTSPTMSGIAFSDPLAAGPYTVTVSAVDSASTVIGTPVTIANAAITMPNGITDLGTIDIPTH